MGQACHGCSGPPLLAEWRSSSQAGCQACADACYSLEAQRGQERCRRLLAPECWPAEPLVGAPRGEGLLLRLGAEDEVVEPTGAFGTSLHRRLGPRAWNKASPLQAGVGLARSLQQEVVECEDQRLQQLEQRLEFLERGVADPTRRVEKAVDFEAGDAESTDAISPSDDMDVADAGQQQGALPRSPYCDSKVTLRRTLRCGARLAAGAPLPFDFALPDFARVEQRVYSAAFERLLAGSGAGRDTEALPLDSGALREFVLAWSSIAEAELDAELAKVATGSMLSQKGFLQLLHDNAMADKVAIDRFLAVSRHGRTVSLEACLAALPTAVQQAAGVRLDEVEWGRILEVVMRDVGDTVSMEKWLVSCHRAARVIRLARFLEVHGMPDGPSAASGAGAVALREGGPVGHGSTREAEEYFPRQTWQLPAHGQQEFAAAEMSEQDPSRSPYEYCVTIDRTSSGRLGIDVEPFGDEALQVIQINEGLVQKWNREHPERMVAEGDRIVEVNGRRHNWQQLVDECHQTVLLRMKLLPVLQTSPRKVGLSFPLVTVEVCTPLPDQPPPVPIFPDLSQPLQGSARREAGNVLQAQGAPAGILRRGAGGPAAPESPGTPRAWPCPACAAENPITLARCTRCGAAKYAKVSNVASGAPPLNMKPVPNTPRTSVATDLDISDRHHLYSS